MTGKVKFSDGVFPVESTGKAVLPHYEPHQIDYSCLSISAQGPTMVHHVPCKVP